MCETCGCGKPGEFKIHGHNHSHSHNHDHNNENDLNHVHSHKQNPDHVHYHGQDDDYDDEHFHDHVHPHHHEHHDQAGEKVINLNMDIMSENNRIALMNRRFFEGRRVLCLNLVSSPGSGKTTILEKTISALKPSHRLFVIEGDQQTLIDADRIEKAGAPAIQINTGSGCHLDARMVETALEKIDVESNSILFIENVGNLVCPALFDLGESRRVVVISVTEGADKPLKYPYMFQSSNLCIINKSDLLPYVDFKTDETIKYALSLNPEMEFIVLSAKTGEGMDTWIEWLALQAQKVFAPVKA
jgi:hydrogenase nickel incorporation protein HypB